MDLRRMTLAVLLACLPCHGCKELGAGATETFSASYSCPEARIDVRPRPDLSPSSLALPASEPSPEVALDPERLAIWRRDRSGPARFYDDRFQTFEARGCGHQAIYICAHPGSGRGGVALNRVSCSAKKLPAGADRPW